MLISIHTLKKYLKVSLKVFILKKIFDDEKKTSFVKKNILFQNENFLLSMLKLFKIPSFLNFLLKIQGLN